MHLPPCPRPDRQRSLRLHPMKLWCENSSALSCSCADASVSLRTQFTLALRGSNAQAHLTGDSAAPSAPPPPIAEPRPSVTHMRRLEICTVLSVMLNVAALSAAIAIGAMHFIDAGATAALSSMLLVRLTLHRAIRPTSSTYATPTRPGDRRSQADRGRCESAPHRAGVLHRRLIVLALLATRPAGTLRVLPAPHRARHSQNGDSNPRTTARAASDTRQPDRSSANRRSVFSLAATDSEHICCLYFANGFIASALWLFYNFTRCGRCTGLFTFYSASAATTCTTTTALVSALAYTATRTAIHEVRTF
eukprot:4824595-Pleurochrysis_carterae.AAC.4